MELKSAFCLRTNSLIEVQFNISNISQNIIQYVDDSTNIVASENVIDLQTAGPDRPRCRMVGASSFQFSTRFWHS